jgi:hypothetical protein
VAKAVLYFREQPLLGKTPDTASTRGCGMSVGVSENASIIAIVGSVLSQEEKKRSTQILRLPRASAKGKYLC